MPKPRPDLWRISVTVKARYLDAFETALAPFAETISSFLADPEEDERDEEVAWRVEGHSRNAPERGELAAALALAALLSDGMEAPEAEVERVPDTDWVAANMLSFKPILSGRFYVRGSHLTEPPPPGRVGLVIDAGTAFGSGEHATTSGCLAALDGLLKTRRFAKVLDLGCGTGILGIAAAKAGRGACVLAADIDPVAVAVARRNAKVNGVAARLATLASEGYAARALGSRRPYDLILANILAGPLKAMAADLAAHLAPGGVAVLSGLLVRQEPMVLAAHRLNGLILERRLRVNGWSTLVLRRP